MEVRTVEERQLVMNAFALQSEDAEVSYEFGKR